MWSRAVCLVVLWGLDVGVRPRYHRGTPVLAGHPAPYRTSTRREDRSRVGSFPSVPCNCLKCYRSGDALHGSGSLINPIKCYRSCAMHYFQDPPGSLHNNKYLCKTNSVVSNNITIVCICLSIYRFEISHINKSHFIHILQNLLRNRL